MPVYLERSRGVCTDWEEQMYRGEIFLGVILNLLSVSDPPVVRICKIAGRCRDDLPPFLERI